MNNENDNNKNKQCNDSCCCGNEPKTPAEGKNVFAETMKEGMSKIFGSAKALIAMTLVGGLLATGCEKIPSPEKMETMARLAGVSAAMVVNATKIDEQSKAVIIDILDKVEIAVPQTNQTFTQVWGPIAKEYVDKLVLEGKVTVAQATFILSGVAVASQAIDYIFDVRYPEARQYKNLIEAAVHGFVGGYKSMSPVNLKAGAKEAKPEYDKEIYDYLKTKAKF